MARMRAAKEMPYNRRAYYKISLILGRNKGEYADRVIEIEKRAILFATPKVPYNYVLRTRNNPDTSAFLHQTFCSPISAYCLLPIVKLINHNPSAFLIMVS